MIQIRFRPLALCHRMSLCPLPPKAPMPATVHEVGVVGRVAPLTNASPCRFQIKFCPVWVLCHSRSRRPLPRNWPMPATLQAPGVVGKLAPLTTWSFWIFQIRFWPLALCQTMSLSPLPTKLPIPATLHDFGTVGRLAPLPICSVLSMFQIWLAPLASRQSRSLMPERLLSVGVQCSGFDANSCVFCSGTPHDRDATRVS